MLTAEQKLEALKKRITKNLPRKIDVDMQPVADGLVVYVDPENLVRMMFYLRDDADCSFKQLVDVFGVDRPGSEKRFEVVYQLLSLKFNNRLRVKVRASDEDVVPSLVEVFSSAGWFEREVWDMYGVRFSDHPDMRRILTDYGFEGFPQRKDFPLTGYKEVHYDSKKKRVVYEPVKLDQEFRTFDYDSPWEGTDYILPGDEKAGAA